MIDGYNFSLDTDTGSSDGNIKISNSLNKDYTWYYYGKRIR